MATWIVGALVIMAVIAAIRKLITDRKAGRSSCGGDCSRCRGCR